MSKGGPIDLLQPRSVRSILAVAVRIYGRHPLLFLLLALVVIVPWELGILAATGYGPFAHGQGDLETRLMIELLRASLIGPLVSAIHIHAVVLTGQDERPRLSDVIRRALQVLPVVAAAEIMANLGIFLGLLAFVLPGVLLAVRWAIAAQTAAIEQGGWLDAIRSSTRLTRGHYVHVLWLLLLGGVISEGLLAGGAALHLGSTSGLASVAVGVALNSLTASFVALTLALLYFDLLGRSRQLEQRPAADTRVEYPHPRDLD